MPTTTTRYVNTDSTAGGDGTTNATAGANRAYASLNEALTANPRNLVTAGVGPGDEIAEFLCSGTTVADTVMPTFSASWVCDATRYIRIAANQNHNGKYNTNQYRLEVTTVSGGIGHTLATATLMHIKWFGIQFRWFINTGITATNSTFYSLSTSAAGARWEMYKCIVQFAHGTATGSTRFISNASASWTHRYANNLFYGMDIDGNAQTAFIAFGTPAIAYIYNCTFAASLKAISGITSTQTRVKNCLFNITNALTGTMNSASDNNASSNTETITNWGASSRSPVTFSFVDSANKDFHLLVSDAGAKGFGMDLTVDTGSGAINVTDDIDSQARVAPFDIGMDQYAPPAGGVSRTDITIRIYA